MKGIKGEVSLPLGGKREEALLGAWVRVPKDAVNMAQVNAQLTLRNPEHVMAEENDEDTTNIPPFVYLFREDDTFVYLPRHYSIKLLRNLPLRRLPYTSRRVNGFTSSYKPRNKTQEEALAAFEGDSDGILCLACGKGKTACALMTAARGNKFPLLIIVHTTALLRQWRKEIMKTYGIKACQIGHIQADKCDWKNKRVAIAMIHSLARKNYPQEFYNHWRLIVGDELHVMAAYSFGPVAHRFTGQRMGLTATPERPDGMETVFKIHFGKIRYEDKSQPLDSEFIFVHTGITIDSPAMKNPMKRIAKVMSAISRHEGRNAIVGKYLAAAKREGRRLIVLGDRTKTLEDLCDAFPGEDKALFIGRIKGEEERAAALEKRAIFASSKMAKEGLDVPSLDTLFITIPFRSEGRLEQSVGRILREYEGKHQPKTYIFVDNNSMMLRFAYGMKNWAERKGYKVTDLYPGKSWL